MIFYELFLPCCIYCFSCMRIKLITLSIKLSRMFFKHKISLGITTEKTILIFKVLDDLGSLRFWELYEGYFFDLHFFMLEELADGGCAKIMGFLDEFFNILFAEYFLK